MRALIAPAGQINKQSRLSAPDYVMTVIKQWEAVWSSRRLGATLITVAFGREKETRYKGFRDAFADKREK
jgi:hypothetical protein